MKGMIRTVQHLDAVRPYKTSDIAIMYDTSVHA